MSSKLYINKDNIKNNIDKLRSYISDNTKIIAMVKANAYGCGANEISNYLEEIGIEDFGVALVSEGVKLRKSGIKSNIIVTSQFLKTDMEDIIKYDLTVSASNLDMIILLNEYARNTDKTVNIHIKIDSGMGRLGFDESNIYDSIKEIKDTCKNINIQGIYTHLSSADTNEEYTRFQLDRFDKIVTNLKNQGYYFKYIHALNSAGTLKYSFYQYTHIRAGILIYGYMPDTSIKNDDFLPCLTLKSPILRIHTITEDSKISYGGTYIAKVGQKIATIQIGYADGLPRPCSNKYSVYVNGNKCPIIGNICMDMCMIDVSNIKDDIQIGDEVTIFKTKEDIDEIANITNSINYAVISRLNERIERILI